jgi:hypothetical protein
MAGVGDAAVGLTHGYPTLAHRVHPAQEGFLGTRANLSQLEQRGDVGTDSRCLQAPAHVNRKSNHGAVGEQARRNDAGGQSEA